VVIAVLSLLKRLCDL